jgi:hypothetical protein
MTQDQALQVLTFGKNVFLTGAAGSGKTYLLNQYIQWLRERGIEPAITASTGIAATHIGGQTIHSWSGIGVKDYLTDYDLDYIEQNERLVKRFRATRVLIIDEVSMLSAPTLDAVNQALQAGLRSQLPFGGIQVVLCGDFFQLPPVSRGSQSIFAFESDVWRELQLHVCYLLDQYRQNDDELLSVLNAIRDGNVAPGHRATLASRLGVEPQGDVPHLYTHNVDVDRLNQSRLDALPGKVMRFAMRTKGSKARVETLKKGLLVPELLELKEGATVMFVKNSQQGGYVNGTVGTVTGFKSGIPQILTRDGSRIDADYESWTIQDGDTVRAEVTQIPVRLAWAVTVHKSQGLTLDAARIDLSKTFVAGQGYVALSRARALSGLYLEGISDRVYERHEGVAHEDTYFRAESEKIVRRLERTDLTRAAELAHISMVQLGGHEPIPGKKPTKKAGKVSTYEKTAALVRDGRMVSEIAHDRGLTPETVVSHLEHLRIHGTFSEGDIAYLLAEAEDIADCLDEIRDAFEKTAEWTLSPVHRAFEGRFSYRDLRFARLFIRPW